MFSSMRSFLKKYSIIKHTLTKPSAKLDFDLGSVSFYKQQQKAM